MKGLLPTIAIAIALLATTTTPARAELHEFTSKDGTKTFWGTLVNYDAKRDKVSVRKTNNKGYSFSADILSEADRKWVKDQYEIMKVGRNVKIHAQVRHGGRKVSKQPGQKTIDSSKYFDVEISNTSREKVEGLTVQYEIHVTQGGRRGVLKGDAESISTLYSGLPHKFKSKKVDLKQKIPLATATGGAGCRT